LTLPLRAKFAFTPLGGGKEAVARVWLIPGGTGQIIVNDRPLLEYLTRISLYEEVIEPFKVTNTLGMFDVKATAKGGGLHGQAGALRHGIARALVVWNEELCPILRRHGLLTRDPRAKERKKYGRKRARRGFQFRKR
jgi:SSU ribosomal protein S9P